jgi:MFS family permease
MGPAQEDGRGKWMALTAALLGWMFDGLEQGLFPLVGRPALQELVGSDEKMVAAWYAIVTCVYLIGAASGGVLFGWLGDRIGRMRAMTLSVLTYALCSGLCGFATSPAQVTIYRFLASLGMGGEWSLGVALVMEIWPDRSRSLLAGLIGASANAGYLLIGLIGVGVYRILPQIKETLIAVGISEDLAARAVAHSGWRVLMFLGAAPALLTFLIRLFVPESERWQKEQGRGTTSHWATRDLAGVLVGTAAAAGIIYVWNEEALPLVVQLVGTVVALVVATLGFLFPVIRYLQRSEDQASREHDQPGAQATGLPEESPASLPPVTHTPASPSLTVKRMLLGACLGGVALLGTWGSMQWAAPWADALAESKISIEGRMPSLGGREIAKADAKSYTQMGLGLGAIVGTIGGALLGGWIGRRITYFLLCLTSLATALVFFQTNTEFDARFLFTGFLAGACTASFYGWLPLYLPELFPTRVRATGQGFSFNFGRILATVGVLQTANLMKFFATAEGGAPYPKACSAMSLIYLVGMVIIWFAPETRGKPLPD